MKKYLIKIVMFFAIVAVVDFAFGKVCDYLRDHTKGGFSGNVHYVCEESNEDIIMMGSSRMRHHYVPQVFEDSLGMTCYNAGIDGNGIILNYGFLRMILQRYTPKLIIYDVTSYDLYADDNTKYLSNMRPYYHKQGIPQIFEDVDRTERLKMKSNLYRYNSNLLGLIGDNYHPMKSFEKGYWPSNKVMNYEPEAPKNSNGKEIDSLKLAYIGKFIDLAKEYQVPLVFVASPTWFGEILDDDNAPAKAVCDKKKVLFIDHFYDEQLCSNKEYWGDATHLNDKGARIFSREFVGEIQRAIESNCY